MLPSADGDVALRTLGGYAPRQARLRPEHAHRYPGVPPGRWESAATVADRVLAGCLLRGNPSGSLGRLLHEAHFEFRGGEAPGGHGQATRPRREDR